MHSHHLATPPHTNPHPLSTPSISSTPHSPTLPPCHRPPTPADTFHWPISPTQHTVEDDTTRDTYACPPKHVHCAITYQPFVLVGLRDVLTNNVGLETCIEQTQQTSPRTFVAAAQHLDKLLSMQRAGEQPLVQMAVTRRTCEKMSAHSPLSDAFSQYNTNKRTHTNTITTHKHTDHTQRHTQSSTSTSKIKRTSELTGKTGKQQLRRTPHGAAKVHCFCLICSLSQSHISCDASPPPSPPTSSLDSTTGASVVQCLSTRGKDTSSNETRSKSLGAVSAGSTTGQTM